MREILFRGRQLNRAEWVEGGIIEGVSHELWQNKGRVFIMIFPEYFSTPNLYEVDPDTVGQYTGLKDKNGKRIFEGDILKIAWHAPRRETVYEIHEVVYSKCGFFTKRSGKLHGQVSNYISPNVNMRCEVIGNIHDNPELLEVGE